MFNIFKKHLASNSIQYPLLYVCYVYMTKQGILVLANMKKTLSLFSGDCWFMGGDDSHASEYKAM